MVASLSEPPSLHSLTAHTRPHTQLTLTLTRSRLMLTRPVPPIGSAVAPGTRRRVHSVVASPTLAIPPATRPRAAARRASRAQPRSAAAELRRAVLLAPPPAHLLRRHREARAEPAPARVARAHADARHRRPRPPQLKQAVAAALAAHAEARARRAGHRPRGANGCAANGDGRGARARRVCAVAGSQMQ